MSEEIILPEGYTKLLYLMSYGRQEIDINYKITSNTGFYTDFMSIGVEKYQHVLSTSSPTIGGILFTPHYNGQDYEWFAAHRSANNDVTRTQVTGLSKTKRAVVQYNFLNSKQCIIDDIYRFDTPDTIYEAEDRRTSLFMYPDSSLKNEGLCGCLYRAKISEGDEIVRDFIPCLDDNGVPCMYDLVGGETYYNQGTGTFGYITYPYENNENYSLPAGYTKCLYLQSDGTQYINTSIYKDFEGNDATSTEDGIIPTDETGLYIKAQRLNYGDYAHFGCRGATYGIYPPRINTRDKTIEYRWNVYKQPFSYDKGDDLIYSSSINLYNDRTIHFNSEDTDWDRYITETLSTIGVPVGLFSWNTNGSFNSQWGGRIYRAKITQGTELIRDFVPCLDASGVPCMYDLVNGYSYYNQGSGSNFEYCIDHQLPSDFIKLKYLEATGTQYINTNYVPQVTDNGDGTYTATTGLYVDTYSITDNGGYPIGCWTASGTDTRFHNHRLHAVSSYTAYGWGAYKQVTTTKGKVAYQSKVNFLNDKKAVIEAPIFSTITNTLGNLSFQPTLPIYMFGINQANKLAHQWKGRIYRAKISEGTEIVRDFVPAYDQRLLRPCMYDIINNVAYYNDGTGEFEYDRDFEGSYTGFAQLGGVGNRIGGTGADGSEYNDFELPSGYTRMGFLESTGKQWMRPYLAALGLSIYAKCQVIGIGHLLGLHEASTPEAYAIRMNINNNGIGCGAIVTFEGNINENVLYDRQVGSIFESEINWNKNYFHINVDGVMKQKDVDMGDGYVYKLPEVAIFALNTVIGDKTWGDMLKYVTTRLFELRAWYEEDSLARNFIPAIDSTGRPCMYDTVTNQPFYNLGTVEFIAGFQSLVLAMALRLPNIANSLTISLPTNDNPTYYEDIIKANNPTWQLTFQYH